MTLLYTVDVPQLIGTYSLLGSPCGVRAFPQILATVNGTEQPAVINLDFRSARYVDYSFVAEAVGPVLDKIGETPVSVVATCHLDPEEVEFRKGLVYGKYPDLPAVDKWDEAIATLGRFVVLRDALQGDLYAYLGTTSGGLLSILDAMDGRDTYTAAEYVGASDADLSDVAGLFAELQRRRLILPVGRARGTHGERLFTSIRHILRSEG